MHPHHLLVTVTGPDRPGVTSALFAALAAHDVEVLDVEQVIVRGRLVLEAALTLHGDPAALRRAATHAADALGVVVDVSLAADIEGASPPQNGRHRVVVLGHPLRAGAVGLVARCVSDLGGNIESMSRVAATPITALELVVSSVDHRQLCATLVDAAAETGTDIAVERSDLHRLAKRLVLVDVDSTLLRGDVFGVLAELAGRPGRSYQLAAPAVELVAPLAGWAGPAAHDGADVLRARAALLAGLPEAALDAARRRIRRDPGAAALVTGLTRLGFRCAAVSSAPAQVIEPLLDQMGLDLVAANRLEVADGELTGRLVGGLVDGRGKAQALLRVAEAYSVPPSQTVAVAADRQVDLLVHAGLGITLHSAPGSETAAAGQSRCLGGLALLLGMPSVELDEPPGEFAPPVTISARQ
jgi:phosphoserine phosphatase